MCICLCLFAYMLLEKPNSPKCFIVYFPPAPPLSPFRLSVRIEESIAKARSSEVEPYTPVFTPWCAADGGTQRMRRAEGESEDGLEVAVLEEEEEVGTRTELATNASSSLLSTTLSAAAASTNALNKDRFVHGDGCVGDDVAFSSQAPWWGNVAPWFSVAPDADRSAFCSRSSGGMVEIDDDGRNVHQAPPAHVDGAGNKETTKNNDRSSSGGTNTNNSDATTDPTVGSATSRARRATVKGFTMDIFYESVTPECLLRSDAIACEVDTTCQWHPQDATCVGNLLTPENIQAMHEIERTIYQFSYNRPESLYLPGMQSMLKYFFAPGMPAGFRTSTLCAPPAWRHHVPASLHRSKTRPLPESILYC